MKTKEIVKSTTLIRFCKFVTLDEPVKCLNIRLSYKERMVNALALGADEGRDKLR